MALLASNRRQQRPQPRAPLLTHALLRLLLPPATLTLDLALTLTLTPPPPGRPPALILTPPTSAFGIWVSNLRFRISDFVSDGAGVGKSKIKVFTHLVTIGHQTKPEHERQVRPLVGLTPDQAQVAWERAIEKAGGRKITARLVKAAVQELGLAPQAQSGTAPVRTAKSERRLLISRTMSELPKLISEKSPFRPHKRHQTVFSGCSALSLSPSPRAFLGAT